MTKTGVSLGPSNHRDINKWTFLGVAKSWIKTYLERELSSQDRSPP